MRVRAMTASGDMTFGQGGANFLVNSPQAVAQLIKTRLNLWTGQWFLDLSAGTPYATQVLGSNTRSRYDAAIQAVILDTPGVLALASYNSNYNGVTRVVTIQATVNTQYGVAVLSPFTPQPSVPQPMVLNIPGRDMLGGIIG